MNAPRLQDSWVRSVEELDPSLRVHAHALPWKLGLTRFRDQGWEGFWTFDPNRRPSRYAAPRAEAEAEDPLILLYDEAHHRAVFYGLLFDRLADGQADVSPERLRLRDALFEGWIVGLTRAGVGRAGAEAAVERAVSLLEEGTRMEEASIRSRRLPTETYARQTQLKLRWCSATPRVLLEERGGRAAALDFRRCYDLFGMAVQCMDDAVDAHEDRSLHGISVPDMLGIEDGGLVLAGAHLTEAASASAMRSGFVSLGDWLRRFSTLLREAEVEGDRELHLAQGRALADALLEAL